MKKDKPILFFKEVKDELGKVNWPTRQATINTSLIVLVVVAMITVYLGIADVIASRIIQLIIG